MSILFSICIPTYNRAKYLQENIDLLLKEISKKRFNEVELCVSDNASTDNTEEVVRKYIQSYPQIKITYKKNEKNLGGDWNFHHAMNMATGEYSLLLGDDDLLVENAIERITGLIENNDVFDVLLFNRIIVGVNTGVIKTESWLRDDIETKTFDFSVPIEEKYYYTLCRSLGGAFSFISAIVYKTEAVTNIEFDESYIGTAYSFLHYILTYLKSGKKLLFFKDALIKCRIGLPSWGFGYKRIFLDYRGYLFIKSKLFANNSGIEFINVLKYEWPINKLLEAFCNMSSDDWNEFKPLLQQAGWSVNDITFIEQIGNSPNWFQSKFKQKLKKTLKRQ